MSKFRGAGKWRAEGPARTNTGSSIRGKTISHPIPFPDDDEFPIRTPGTGIALPLGADGVERLRLSTATDNDNTSHHTGVAVSDFVSPAMGSRTPSIPLQPAPEAHVRRTPPNQSSQPSALRNSVASVPSALSVGKPQRKKSSIRSVFGRLFGKKRKGSASSSTQGQSDSSDVRAGQHRSDPSALNRVQQGTAGAQKRSASLPINEFNRALRSHSIITEDFPLQNTESDANRESLQTDGQKRPRRATTPSRLWTPNKIPGYVDWTGLSPRPASSHARGSKVVSEAEARSTIGTAITSGSHPNRRSRSLGELQEAAKTHVITRRRSDEIRYWRESYDPGLLSPMSSNKAETEDPLPVDEPEDARDEVPQEEPQPFNFGPLGEMAGMKITQAASLETRVQRLEHRMIKVEKSVSRLKHAQSESRLQLQDPPKRNSARNRSSSVTRPTTQNSEASLPKHPRYRETQPRLNQGSQKRSSSYGSSRPSTVSTDNPQHPSFDTFSPQIIPTSEIPFSSSNTARPLSTSTTIRGIPSSSPTMPVEGSLTGEHYTALTNIIAAEKSARHQLEFVVHSLQRQLQALQAANATAYPTPGSETAGDTSQEGGMGGGDFSGFEQDDSSDDDGRYINDDFRTPNEERGQFGAEIFGDAANNAGDTKSAPRTLSLSQITLGKGVQPSLNF